MVNEVEDRSSLFGSNIQRILQRSGQQLIGLFMMTSAILWSFVLLLSTYGASFSNLIFEEAILSNFQILSSGIVAPTMVTIGLSSWTLSAFLIIWSFRFMFHLNTQTFFNRAVFLPILAA